MTNPHRIDVHHHPSPPSYINSRSERDRAYPPQMNWALAKSLDDMDRGGVATAMLSLPHSVQIPTRTWRSDSRRANRLRSAAVEQSDLRVKRSSPGVAVCTGHCARCCVPTALPLSSGRRAAGCAPLRVARSGGRDTRRARARTQSRNARTRIATRSGDGLMTDPNIELLT